jgi:hypothetical protein
MTGALEVAGHGAAVEPRKAALYRAELDKVRGNKVLLVPEDVVDWAAAHPDSPLHEAFEWDDTAAAARYRIWQARVLITIVVAKVDDRPRFVSLSIDRVKPSGGYRPIDEVRADPELRAVLLRDALAEYRRVRAKYAHVKELSDVADAVDRADAAFGGAGTG